VDARRECVIAALLSAVGFWGKARVVFGSAPVYGVVMLLVCYTIAGAIAGQVAGFPNTPTFGQPFNFVMASIPFAVAIVVVLLLRSTKLRLISLLLGAILAVLVAVTADKMSFAAVARVPWIGLSVLFPFGFQFDPGATLVMLIAFIADLGQVVGCYLIVGETIGKEKLCNKRIDGGIFTESIGSAISGAFGGMPTVTYSQNIGAILVTGIGSRFIFATAGIILLILGLCPKVGAVVASIPGPIVGGLLFVAIVMLTMQSIRVLGMMPHTNANIFTAGGGTMIGFIAAALPREVIAMLPAVVRSFVSSGVIMGFLAAAVMNTIFNLILKRSEAEEPPTLLARADEVIE
jgi:xanthine/uracil permease